MTIQRSTYASPVEALAALIRTLVAYEQRYQKGDMGDAADFVEWAGDYQHYLQLKEEGDSYSP